MALISLFLLWIYFVYWAYLFLILYKLKDSYFYFTLIYYVIFLWLSFKLFTSISNYLLELVSFLLLSFSKFNSYDFDCNFVARCSISVYKFIFMDYNSIIRLLWEISCFTKVYFCFIKLFTNSFVSVNFFSYWLINSKFLPFFSFYVVNWIYSYETWERSCLFFELCY